jgi:hypothetical protein
MIRRVTNSDDLLRLTVTQENAIELLLAGNTDTAAAKALGVHRTTVSRWRGDHPGFKAELDRRRAEVFGGAIEKLRGLLPTAVDVLAEELRSGNALAAATAICRLTGIDKLPLPQMSPPDAQTAMVAMIKAEMRRLWEEKQAAMSVDELCDGASTPSAKQQQELATQALDNVVGELWERLTDESDANPDATINRLRDVRASV